MPQTEPLRKVLGTSRSVTQDVDRYDLLIVELQTRLDALSSQQEELEEAREQLLIDRESGLLHRRSIQKQRIRTGDAEITLMDAFRNHFKQLRRPLPDDILNAYDKAEKQHLALRRLEEEHLQAEEDLGASEWRFTGMETDFYQYHISQLLLEGLEDEIMERTNVEATKKTSAIVLDPIPPTGQVQYQVIVADHNRLIKRFDALRKQRVIRMETLTQFEDNQCRIAEDIEVDREATTLASELLDLITKCEARLQQLRPSVEPIQRIALGRKQQISEPDFGHGDWFEHFDTPSRAHSEGGTSASEDHIPIGERMEDWSLESLKNSALEKLQYLNILRPRIKNRSELKLGFEHWEPQVTRLWVSDHVEEPSWPSWQLSVDTGSNKEQIQMLGSHDLTDKQSESDHRSELSGMELQPNCCANCGSQLFSNRVTPTEASIPPFLINGAPIADSDHFTHMNEDPTTSLLMSLTSNSGMSVEPMPKALVQENQPEKLLGASLTINGSGSGAQPLERCDSAQGSDSGKSLYLIPSERKYIVLRDCDVIASESKELLRFTISYKLVNKATHLRLRDWASTSKSDQFISVETADDALESLRASIKNEELANGVKFKAICCVLKEHTEGEEDNNAYENNCILRNHEYFVHGLVCVALYYVLTTGCRKSVT
jgi:hypothetical protein